MFHVKLVNSRYFHCRLHYRRVAIHTPVSKRVSRQAIRCFGHVHTALSCQHASELLCIELFREGANRRDSGDKFFRALPLSSAVILKCAVLRRILFAFHVKHRIFDTNSYTLFDCVRLLSLTVCRNALFERSFSPQASVQRLSTIATVRAIVCALPLYSRALNRPPSF